MCFITVFKKKQINQNKENAHYATDDEEGGFFLTQTLIETSTSACFVLPSRAALPAFLPLPIQMRKDT